MSDQSGEFSGCPHLSHLSGLLDHLLVLDLADEQATFCSKLLADLGATVIKVEGPDGDPSRESNPNDFAYTNINKLGVTIDLKAGEGMRAFRALVKRADVLVETTSPSRPQSLYLEPRRLHRINPCLVHISITPFGRTGLPGGPAPAQWDARASWNIPGCQPFYTASLFGAVAALIRLRKRRVTGAGSYLDLSIHEAVASMLESDLANTFGNKPGATAYKGFFILSSKDGYVQIPILRNWDSLLELMTSEGKAADLSEKEWQNQAYREENLNHIVTSVQNWTRCHTSRELFELGQAMGFPWASIDSIQEAFKNPQFKAREFIVHIPLSQGGPSVSFPGLPYKFSSYTPAPPRPAPAPGGHAWTTVLEAYATRSVSSGNLQTPEGRSCPDERIFQGMRVIDLTRMVSGPYATRIFADFGAEVIKIQSEKTARGAEQNDSPQFSIWNRNKRSITLDLSFPGPRESFLKLVAESDIVVENFSPRVMANWGLHYERLREVNPSLVMVSISAMGHTGPWKDYVGFAPTFHALSGLISANSASEEVPPAEIGYPYADLIAGLYAALATLSALEYRDRTGKGQHVDVSALEAMCTFLGPAFPVNRAEATPSQSPIPGDWEAFPIFSARRFFVQLNHPVLGKVLSVRTPLWDWRRRPGWKASPLLGEANGKIAKSK